MSLNTTQIKNLGDYLRYLSTMGIQRAKSGHPGLPLGCADIGVSLYGNHMKSTGKNPAWMNRDRFILSAGHPEYEHEFGIEATTGPLGQGFANDVGVAPIYFI